MAGPDIKVGQPRRAQRYSRMAQGGDFKVGGRMAGPTLKSDNLGGTNSTVG